MYDLRITRRCNKCGRSYKALMDKSGKIIRFLCDGCKRLNLEFAEKYLYVGSGYRIKALPGV